MTVSAVLLLPLEFSPSNRPYVDEGGTIPVRVTRSSTALSEAVQITPGQYGSSGIFAPGQVETVAFLAGTSETSRIVNFKTLDDTIYEDFESFYLTVTPLAGTTLDPSTYLAGAIRNNDTLPKIGLSTSTPQVVENAEGARFRFEVTRNGPDLSMETRVEIRFSPEGSTPINSADLYGANSSLGAVFVNFEPGETVKLIDIGILNDNNIEAAESLRANVYSAVSNSPGSLFRANAPNELDYNGSYTAVVTIINDDPNPPVPPPVVTPPVVEVPKPSESIATYSAAAQVIRIYDTMLDRFPEAAGRNYYVDQLNAGTATLRSLQTNFQNSPEFIAKYGNTSNEQFIDLLYENTLNRDPEPGAIQYYVNRILSGDATRGIVVENFSESPEHIALVERAYNIDFI